jgi:hypothetical protein
MSQEQQQLQIQEPVQQQALVKVKKKWGIKEYVLSPYILLLVPLLVGGFFLVLNPQYVVLAMNYPFAAAFILAIPVALFIIKLVINFFSVIEQWVRLQFEKARSAKKSQFLEFVIAVFMFVSINEGGPLFNHLQGNGLGGALGYITVFGFDLVAVLCMRGRAKMLRKGHDGKARIYQMGVWICALVSVFANLYEAVHNAKTLDASNPLTFAAPLAGIAFPVMIIFLSYATEADADDVDDPEVYRKEQEKLVDFVKAKREIAAQILDERIQMSLLRQREFFLKGWLFTKKKMNVVIEVATQQVMKNIKDDVTQLKQSILDEVNGLRQKVVDEITVIVTNKVVSSTQTQVDTLLSENAKLKDTLQQIQSDREDEKHELSRRIEQLQTLIVSQIEQQNNAINRQVFDVQTQLESRFNGVIDSAVTRSIEAANEVCNQMIAHTNTTAYSGDNDGGMSDDDGDTVDSNREGKQKSNLMDEVMVQVVVKNYPIVESWLSRGMRTITIEQVIHDTGHSPQLVRNREKAGVFQGVKRAGYYRVSSVIKWLFSEPLPGSNKRGKSKKTSDKLDGKLDDNGDGNQPITDPTIPAIPAENVRSNGNHNGSESPLGLLELEVVNHH